MFRDREEFEKKVQNQLRPLYLVHNKFKKIISLLVKVDFRNVSYWLCDTKGLRRNIIPQLYHALYSDFHIILDILVFKYAILHTNLRNFCKKSFQNNFHPFVRVPHDVKKLGLLSLFKKLGYTFHSYQTSEESIMFSLDTHNIRFKKVRGTGTVPPICYV